MANRKMTLSKTKLAQTLSMGISSRAKSLSVAAALLLSASNASALGLGSFEVASNLDQPLNGSIELRVAPGDDLETLTAVIASREDFESLGIDYPSYLENFSLLLDNVAGERRLRVTSNNVVIKEPFIHFLVRVEWSGGSFLREYTALIDPPVYAAGAPSSISEPRQVGTDTNYQNETSEVDSDLIVEDLVADEASGQDSSADEDPLVADDFYNDDSDTASEESEAEYSSSSQPTDASYGPVETGESLSVIAQDLQRQFPDLSIYQIMKVLFEENTSSFIGANINGLIKGSILKIGDLDAIRSVDVSESKSFYISQIADWNPQLLLPSSSDSLNVGQDSYNFQDDSSFTSDSDDSFQQDNFQVGASTESNDYVSSDQGDTREGEVLALRQEVTSLRSSLASSELEKLELNERISLLEGQLSDMNRLAELSIENADLAKLEATLAEQNEFLDEVDDGVGVGVGDEAEDFADNGEDNSSIDEFLSLSDEAINDVAQDAEAAIDGLIDDQNLAVDEFGVDQSVSDGESLDNSELESVIEEADSDTAVVTPQVGVSTINVPQEKSFFEKIKESLFEGSLWKVLVGLGALLAAGAAILFIRRRRVDEEFEVSMLSIESNSHSVGNSSSSAASTSMSASHTASMASEAIADKETSFLTVYSDSDAVVQADEVDPVAEADVYIAYGRDEQAEEVLLDGVVSHPDRIDIKQKLLSLYHKRQNAEGFERIAEELYSQRAALTGDVWKQVCEMGKEVAPNNPLFDLSGDDLNTAEEANSELLLEGDDISEVSLEFDEVASPPNDEESDHLDAPFPDQQSDLEEELTIEDQSEMVVGSLAEDESIQLINFDDGRSEISELDEIEIDALEFAGDIPTSMDLSKESDDDVVEISVSDDDEDLLDFNFDDASDEGAGDDGDDLERAFGEVQEVSDLEIDPDYDEARTQYELAKVFVDLGDEDGARKILVELVADKANSSEVLSDAQALLDSINV
jgi:pilus assembly protein FimV